MQVVSQIIVHKIREIGAGQGRNSKVYLAHDPQLNGDVALKEIPISTFVDTGEYFKEARLIYKNNSPRVVPIQYACCDSQFVRMVMPYFSKGSLQDKIESHPLTVRETIMLADQFLTGLHYVHSNNVAHLDVKPTNILISNDGSAMIADFGQSMPAN